MYRVNTSGHESTFLKTMLSTTAVLINFAICLVASYHCVPSVMACGPLVSVRGSFRSRSWLCTATNSILNSQGFKLGQPKCYSIMPHTNLSRTENERVGRLLKFLDCSPDAFHVVHSVAETLQKSGFQQLYEDDDWIRGCNLRPGGKYFFKRHDSSLIAFQVGRKFQNGNGFKILAAHTDSPHLKIRPISKRAVNHGVIQLNVECYGGGLWHTWFDRDLSISGRVIVRSPNGDQLFRRLLNINRPVVRIPTLCIHLRTSEERDNFNFNKEEHLQPIICDQVHAALLKNHNFQDPWLSSQEPMLLTLISEYLQCNVQDIADFQLSLYDNQNASRVGMMSEFVCGSRLDNLASCFAIMEAMIDHGSNLEDDESISVMALFDHEEVGSESIVGAGSTLIADTLQRLSVTLMGGETIFRESELFHQSKRRSFILSVDMAHAVHPNYPTKHERSHSPVMNKGLIVKSNCNQRYATNWDSAFIVRELARKAGVDLQEFAVRNDCPCGSTIGPILSANTGILAADVGMPQLSMHSIREMMGTKDLSHAYRFFSTFLLDKTKIEEIVH